MSETFKSALRDSKKPKSFLINFMSKSASVPRYELQHAIDCKSAQTLRNKISTNAFTFDEILKTADASDFKLILLDEKTGKSYEINADDYFANIDKRKEKTK